MTSDIKRCLSVEFWKWQIGIFIRKKNYNHNCLNQIMEGNYYCEVCNPIP